MPESKKQNIEVAIAPLAGELAPKETEGFLPAPQSGSQ